MQSKGVSWAAVFAATCISLFAASARAQDPAPAPPPETTVTGGPDRASNNNLVSVFGELGYAYTDSGFGIGGRYQKVVARNAVIKSGPIHDEFGLEAGVDYYHYNFGFVGNSLSYNEIAIVLGSVWNFWLLDDKLALYPKIDVAYRIGSFSNDSGTTALMGYGGIWIQGAAGVVYRLGGVSLRAELGSGSLRLGAGFSFF